MGFVVEVIVVVVVVVKVVFGIAFNGKLVQDAEITDISSILFIDKKNHLLNWFY